MGQLPQLPPHLRLLLFANGKDIKQIQTWLGQADAAFTLRTYVHLLEEGVGSADFLDDAVEVSDGPWSHTEK